MIPVTSFKGKSVAVFGLGGSGISTARALLAGGATVAAWDDTPARVETARDAGIPVVDLKEAEWAGFAALVLAPGVPLTHPAPHWTVEKASCLGIEIIGDIELFCRERRNSAPDAPLIAITGTNGKSTTTALIAHLLAEFGLDVQMGGNIGTPILDLEPPAPGRHYVIECSSYQIDLAPSLDPTIGLHMNLSPDHLDRHGSLENYAAIKARLVSASETAIVGVDDRLSASIADDLARKGLPVRRVSSHLPQPDGVYADGATLIEAHEGAQVPVTSLEGIDTLRGAHNAQNAAAAFAALRALDLPGAKIADAMRSFPGLHHRMELVERCGRILFVNDTKATNADAAARGLASFERIYWIAGGRAKAGGITPLKEYFPKVARAYLIGEAAEEFAATLDGDVRYEICGTLDVAVARAAEDARLDPAPEVAVLLSPACASFDQYANFELRGTAFKDAVRDLDFVKNCKEVA